MTSLTVDEFRHGSITLLVVCVCVFSFTQSKLLNILCAEWCLQGTVLSKGMGWEMLKGIICPRGTQLFFRQYKGCNVFWYNVSLAKASSISFISLSPRGKHVQEHGKEESCFFTVPLFSLPFCGVGLKPKKAPCHAHSQASTFLPC